MDHLLLNNVKKLNERLAEISELLTQEVIIQNRQQYRDLSCEYAEISTTTSLFSAYSNTLKMLQEAKEMLHDSDLRHLAKDETSALEEQLLAQEETIKLALIPKDPNDKNNVFLEIRAGTGGDESALFCADLLRMYTYYVEARGWTIEPVSISASDLGGYKEVIARISGHGAYSRFKFESGGHRVQRVPQTETQGRVHTSACTIAVMPEVEEISSVMINPSDLRVDTFRSSGAGGQHVNKTDSAIRVTHFPTGIVVECQENRSQHKNRAHALSVLAAKIMDKQNREQQAKQAETRRSLIGSGDRSERIRTYNFPQGRITDHRIHLTLYKIEEIMHGNLDVLIDPLILKHQTDLLVHWQENNS